MGYTYIVEECGQGHYSDKDWYWEDWQRSYMKSQDPIYIEVPDKFLRYAAIWATSMLCQDREVETIVYFFRNWSRARSDFVRVWVYDQPFEFEGSTLPSVPDWRSRYVLKWDDPYTKIHWLEFDLARYQELATELAGLKTQGKEVEKKVTLEQSSFALNILMARTETRLKALRTTSNLDLIDVFPWLPSAIRWETRNLE